MVLCIFLQTGRSQQKADIGLVLGNDDVQERKKRQLQIERQKEYNELITKVNFYYDSLIA